MIETNRFRLTKSRYFQILVYNLILQRWWLYGACILLGIWLISNPARYGLFAYYGVVCFVAPLFTVLLLFAHAQTKDNAVFFSERALTLDADRLIVKAEGIHNELATNVIIKKVKRDTYYLLYVSKNGFIYVPRDAFNSESDIEFFERQLGIS